jgi:hypothetical protein
MPNWVTNGVVITGNAKDIALVKEQLARPTQRQHIDWKSNEITTATSESLFQFWNIIAPTNLDEYHDKPNESQDLNNPNHWYAWNISNWGVKWDASDVYFAEESETPESLTYTFSTPWGVPVPALVRLSEQYPELEIENEWEEEQGYGGTLVFSNGEVEETDSYDYKCWECDEKFQSRDEAKFDEESGEHLCKEALVNG